MIKKLITAVIFVAMLPMTFNTYAFAEDSLSIPESNANDNEDSYTVVVTNDDLDDEWISKVNFNYDLIWTISGDTVSCKSSDGSIHFDAEIIDDTLYVDGTDFLFAVCETPNIFEDDEGCNAMLDWVLKLQDVRNIVFSDSVETLEMFGSSVLFARIENIEFGNSFKRIGENTIGITSLRELKFPESLKEIGSNAFRTCTHIEQVTIPENVEKIGENAFYGCTELKDITILPKDIELSSSGIGYSRSGELLSDVVIRGYSGSTSEAYANKNNFEFVPLNEETTTTTSSISTSTETTTTVVENTTTETSSETTSQNTASSTSGTTTAVSTTSKKSSAKENSPKTGDKGIIGIGAVLFSALGMFCISKKRQ